MMRPLAAIDHCLSASARPAPSRGEAPVPGLKRQIESLIQAATPGLSGFRLLLSGQDAFSARAEAIAQAVETIDLQYYITHDGVSTRLLLGELVQAANRGVRVRLLLDDFASDARDHRILLSVAHPNIEMKVFNPPHRGRKHTATRKAGRLIELSHQHRRMHNKLLLVDRDLVIMGGRNLGDEYFDADTSRNFVDIDLLGIGSAAQELSASFEAYWRHSLAVPIEQCLRKPGRRLGQSRQPRPMSQEIDNAWSDAPERCAQLAAYREAPQLGTWLDHLVWARATVLWDSPDKLATPGVPEQEHLMTPSLLPVALGVCRELTMVSAYFVPTEAGLAYFKACAARGVSVRVLTNSLEATDVPLVHGGYQRYREALLKAGVRLFEMRKRPAIRSSYSFPDTPMSLHSKAAVFDGRQVFVGPLNLDPRSVLWNCELGVLIDSPALADAVSQLLVEGFSRRVSYEVQLDGNAPDAGLAWHYEEGHGRPFCCKKEPANPWRRFNAWLGRVSRLESFL